MPNTSDPKHPSKMVKHFFHTQWKWLVGLLAAAIVVFAALVILAERFKEPVLEKNDNTYSVIFPMKHQVFTSDQLNIVFDKELPYESNEALDFDIWLNGKKLDMPPSPESEEWSEEMQEDKMEREINRIHHYGKLYYISFNADVLQDGDRVRVSADNFDKRSLEDGGGDKTFQIDLNHQWVYQDSVETFLQYTEKITQSDPRHPEYKLFFDSPVELSAVKRDYKIYSSKGEMDGEYVSCRGPDRKLRTSMKLEDDKKTVIVRIKKPLRPSEDPLCIYLVPKVANSNWNDPIDTLSYDVPRADLLVNNLFNPELNFLSELEINFNTPMFSDSNDEENPDTFVKNREAQKKKLLNEITVNPEAEIDVDNVYFTPTKAIVPLRLKEETSYSIHLDSMKDVFGEKAEAQSIDVETGKQIYMGLKLSENKSIYRDTTPPRFKFVQYNSPAAEVKLCRIGMSEYGIIEHMYLDRDKLEGANYFFEKGIDLVPTEECFTQKVEADASEYVSEFEMDELLGTPAKPGLYYMTFSAPYERKLEEAKRVQPTIFFSIVDSHLTMKLSKNGKAFIWLSDFASGEGIEGATITGYKADYTRLTREWNENYSEQKITYMNPQEGVFGKPITLGKTDKNGFLEIDIPTELNAYFSALFGQYGWDSDDSKALVITAESGDRLSYLSNQWNDGIADWNFGYQPEYAYYYGEESIRNRGEDFLAHLFTERKLYLPGEKVYLKAIIREFGKTLSIPSSQETFTLTAYDSQNELLFEENFKPNEFGSILKEFTLGENIPLGSYYVALSVAADEGRYQIMRTNFNVEEFKKPTFKVDVQLDSPDIENGFIVDPEVTKKQTGWGYSYNEYAKKLSINATVHADYYSGGVLTSAKYEYNVYKQYYYDSEYWDDCYWGCYWEPYKEYYSSGHGEIAAGGVGQFTIDVDHASDWSDYNYIVEVTIQDQTGERITGSGNIIVKLPENRSADPNVQLKIATETQFIHQGEMMNIALSPNLKWNKTYNDQFRLEVLHRTYATTHKMNTEGRLVPQVDFEDEGILDLKVNDNKFDLKDGQLTHSFKPKKAGEYILKLYDGNDQVTSEMKLYVYDPESINNTAIVDDNKIQILSEKVSYKLGDEARFLIRLPFENARVLVTTEKTHVVAKDIIDISGNTYLYSLPVDDTYVPNAYISFVAFQKGGTDYKVGYAEIVVDQSEKKLDIQSAFDETVYRPGEEIAITLNTKDINGKPVSSELAVAVVDESLIALLGNIDLDILKKFYQKIAFQTDTSLTSVAMQNYLYFSRKGFVGGSGEKGGDGSVFTRSIFKNTAYYNGSVITDANGKATVKFTLPDNIGNFRVIVLGSTKQNHFGAHENSFSVRKELVVEDIFPLIFRQGDTMQLGANVFNHTDQAVKVEAILESQELDIQTPRQTISIPANDRVFVTWPSKVKNKPLEQVRYKITATSTGGYGDGIEKSVPIASTPLIADYVNYKESFTDAHHFTLDYDKKANEALSFVQFSASTSLLAGIDKIVTTLLQYPHGCIEQTVSATIPNAILLQFSNFFTLDFDREELDKNLKAGVDRILAMQQPDGGFGYWPGDRTTNHHYSSVGIWGLATMKQLGAEVDPEALSRAESYLSNLFKNISSADIEGQLPELTTGLLALGKLGSESFAKAREVLNPYKSKFGIHEKLYYALALAEANETRYHNEIMEMAETIDPSTNPKKYDYWDSKTYKALLAQLLLKSDPENPKVDELIMNLYNYNYDSYYLSTQTKMQAFLAFIEYIKRMDQSDTTVTVNYKLDGFEGVLNLTGKDIFKKKKIYFSDFDSVSDQSFNFEFDVQQPENEKKVYVDADVVVYPENLKDVTASSNGIHVTRTYYAIEMDKTQSYYDNQLNEVPIPQDKLKLGETYMVKLDIKADRDLSDVSIEDHLPAGFQVINSRFQTSSSELDNQWNWPFYHVEYKRNMVFATAEHLEGDTDQKFIYFITPIVEGDYSVPPVSVFPMYQPQIEGHTGYGEVKVVR